MERYHEAKDICINTGLASVSQLQRKMRVGYNVARRLMDQMVIDGIVTANEGSIPFYSMAITKEDLYMDKGI